jgi:hypothetical protein
VEKTTKIFTAKEALPLLVISLTASLFAKLLVDLMAFFATIYVAYDFDIYSYFDLNGVTFLTPTHSPEWYLDSKVSILLAAPIASMFIGLFSMAGLILIKRKLISFFFLLFWLNLYAFNNSAGILVDDFIAKTGFYNVVVLYKLPNEVLMVTSILAIYILYRIGMVNTLIFRTSIEEQFKNLFKNRLFIFLITIFVPWIANGVLPLFSKNPNIELMFFLRGASMVVLFFPFFTYRPKKKMVSKVEIISKVLPADWVNTALYILGIFMLFMVLNHGVFIFSNN